MSVHYRWQAKKDVPIKDYKEVDALLQEVFDVNPAHPARPASADPPVKAASQTQRARLVRQRYSKATPRKTRASSMTMIGMYSAGMTMA